MNEEQTQNQIQSLTDDEITLQRFKALPKIVQDAILNSGWQNIVRGLVNEYKLRIDQGNELENIVFGLMLGMFDSEELFDFINKDLGLEEDRAKDLFNKIDQKIFNDIYNNVMKSGVYDLNDEDSEVPMQTSDEAEETLKRLTEDRPKENYVKEGVDNAAKNDEILTVTRDEILNGIEKPEDFKNNSDSYPDLEKSNVMPNKETSDMGHETPAFEKPATPSTETAITEAPNNLPSGEIKNTAPVETKEESEDGPIDPISAGLSSSVSTNNKGYKGSDPYRESIE